MFIFSVIVGADLENTFIREGIICVRGDNNVINYGYFQIITRRLNFLCYLNIGFAWLSLTRWMVMGKDN